MANLVPWPVTFTVALGLLTALGFLASLAEDVPAPRVPQEAPFEPFRRWEMAYLHPGQRSAPYTLEAPSREGRLSCIVYTTSEPEGLGASQETRQLYTSDGRGQWRRNGVRVIIRPNSGVQAMAVRYRNTTDGGIYVFVRQVEVSREGACGRVAEDQELPRPKFPPAAHTYGYYFSGELGSPDRSARKISRDDIEDWRVAIIDAGKRSEGYRVESKNNVHRCLVWNASLPPAQIDRLALKRATREEGRWRRVTTAQIAQTAKAEAEAVVYQTYYYGFDNNSADKVIVEVGSIPIPPNNDTSACGYNPELLGRPRYEESIYVSGLWRGKE